MKTTIRDIARETKLSVGTISMALNDNIKIKEETKQKVFRAIRQLQYDPTNSMQLVKRLKVKTIALVIPESAYTMEPFYHRAIMSFKTTVEAKGYDCIIYSDDELDKKGAAGLTCDGVVLFCPIRPWETHLKQLVARKVPVALVRRACRIPGVITVSDSDEKGALLALEHLYRLGHCRIGYVGSDVQAGWTRGRKQAFDRFVADRKLEPAACPAVDVWQQNDETTRSALRQALQGPLPPTAFFCDSDGLAAGVIKVLAALGYQVPGQVAVTGYNDDFTAGMFNPGITTVRVPVEQMCRLACTLVADSLESGRTGSLGMTLENELVVRQSCGFTDQAGAPSQPGL